MENGFSLPNDPIILIFSYLHIEKLLEKLALNKYFFDKIIPKVFYCLTVASYIDSLIISEKSLLK